MIASLDTPCGTVWISGGSEAVDEVSWSPIEGGRHKGDLDWIMYALTAYFDGKAEKFPGGLIFMGPGILWARNCQGVRPLTGSQGILEAISRIPYGSTMTYGNVASNAGKPGAARAVGSVCRSNPLPVIVPCHRVVGVNSLGGYTPGIKIKEFLLEIERKGCFPSTCTR